MIDSLVRDLRYVLRGFHRRPAFAAIAVLTLALGIGANSVIFSVVNGVLLKPLPYARPDRLAMIFGHWALKDRAEQSEPEYWDLREQARSFEHIAAYADGSANLTGSGRPERLLTGYMTADALTVLGVAPMLGRPFTADEDLTLAAVGIFGVISYSVTQRTREFGIRLALGEDPGSTQRSVILGGMRLVGASIAIGLLASLGLARFLSGLLYQVRPADPLTFVGISALLAAVALVACYLPARRATRVDPATALRSE